jgi:hypothetical protein
MPHIKPLSSLSTLNSSMLKEKKYMFFTNLFNVSINYLAYPEFKNIKQ